MRIPFRLDWQCDMRYSSRFASLYLRSPPTVLGLQSCQDTFPAAALAQVLGVSQNTLWDCILDRMARYVPTHHIPRYTISQPHTGLVQSNSPWSGFVHLEIFESYHLTNLIKSRGPPYSKVPLYAIRRPHYCRLRTHFWSATPAVGTKISQLYCVMEMRTT